MISTDRIDYIYIYIYISICYYTHTHTHCFHVHVFMTHSWFLNESCTWHVKVQSVRKELTDLLSGDGRKLEHAALWRRSVDPVSPRGSMPPWDREAPCPPFVGISVERLDAQGQLSCGRPDLCVTSCAWCQANDAWHGSGKGARLNFTASLAFPLSLVSKITWSSCLTGTQGSCLTALPSFKGQFVLLREIVV